MVEFCDRIGIMYAGNWWRWRRAKAILTAPLHPYTRGLGNSFPHGAQDRAGGDPWQPLNLLEVPVGCRFQARCAKVHARCRQEYTRLARSARLTGCLPPS